ncbi:MAG: hypothetical protein ABWY02_09695, partial [Telluria sp.]
MAVQEILYRGYEFTLSGIRDWAFLETLLVALVVSLAACAINIVTERWHGRYSFDLDVRGIQKVHKNLVPRTGGIALLSGVFAVAVFGNFHYLPISLQGETRIVILKLLLAAIPAFTAGIIEDLTKKVSVRTRFCSIFASAVLAALLLGAHLPR